MEKGGTNVCSLIIEGAETSTTNPKTTPMLHVSKYYEQKQCTVG